MYEQKSYLEGNKYYLAALESKPIEKTDIPELKQIGFNYEESFIPESTVWIVKSLKIKHKNIR